MPGIKTEITEIATGLATLGFDDPLQGLRARPPQMRHLTNDHWERLEHALLGGQHAADFEAAWSNGLAFLQSADALRGRPPHLVEWKGAHQTPGYDTIPADLRIDHVYLISCKYLSRILFNASPAHLFDRALARRDREGGREWYLEAAPEAYQDLYAQVRAELDGRAAFPAAVMDLAPTDRLVLRDALNGAWPPTVLPSYQTFCAAVSLASAARWRALLPTLASQEIMLWRLLRLASAPYFVLGSSKSELLRLRIYSPWDWRQEFALQSFEVTSDAQAGQPLVRWCAQVRRLETGQVLPVEGHVEIRWSHGRFRGHPEAKIYLDTPHSAVPGYAPLR